MATIILPDGQRPLENVPDEYVATDKDLRDWLGSMLPDLANATFERKTANGLLTVTVSKRAGTKG